jgi:hypothetical protein
MKDKFKVGDQVYNKFLTVEPRNLAKIIDITHDKYILQWSNLGTILSYDKRSVEFHCKSHLHVENIWQRVLNE